MHFASALGALGLSLILASCASSPSVTSGAPPAPVPPDDEDVDGATVITDTTAQPDGSTQTTQTVPPVAPNREEDPATPNQDRRARSAGAHR